MIVVILLKDLKGHLLSRKLDRRLARNLDLEFLRSIVERYRKKNLRTKLQSRRLLEKELLLQTQLEALFISNPISSTIISQTVKR